MTADSLAAFLLRMYDEKQEDMTRVKAGYSDWKPCEWHEADCEQNSLSGGDCDCDVPAYVLADIEAKRRIVEGIVPERDPYAGHPDYDPLWILQLLALPFADHPDYRAEEWAP